jgi:hypothetical protein
MQSADELRLADAGGPPHKKSNAGSFSILRNAWIRRLNLDACHQYAHTKKVTNAS